MLTVFYFFNWMQFVARMIFTITLLLCIKGVGVHKLFQVILKSVNKWEVRSRQKCGGAETIVFQYHTACFIMSAASSNVSSSFWKKKTHIWICIHSCDDAISNNPVRRGAEKGLQIHCSRSNDCWLINHKSFPKRGRNFHVASFYQWFIYEFHLMSW